MNSTRRTQSILGGLVALVLLVATAAPSMAITYNVDRVVGAGGVTGFIQTDGTIGTLSTGNIADWNLLLDDGVGTFNLLGPLSGDNSGVRIGGSSFIATASDITFNFSATDFDFVLFQSPRTGSGGPNWCLSDLVLPCNLGPPDVPAIGEALGFFGSGPGAEVRRVGTLVIASVGGTNPVPEPSTMILLGSGLAGLVIWRMKKSV